MKKSELKTGMKVVTRERLVFNVMKDVEGTHGDLLVSARRTWLSLRQYSEDLKYVGDSGLDIVEVYGTRIYTDVINANIDLAELIWEGNEGRKSMTIEEIEEELGYSIDLIR